MNRLPFQGLTEEQDARVRNSILETVRALATESRHSPESRDQAHIDFLVRHLEMLRGLLK